MRVERFKSALANVEIRPKSVKISPSFWELLKNENLIKQESELLKGYLDLGNKSPSYSDVWLVYSSELEITGEDFKLPPASKF